MHILSSFTDCTEEAKTEYGKKLEWREDKVCRETQLYSLMNHSQLARMEKMYIYILDYLCMRHKCYILFSQPYLFANLIDSPLQI
jgi:hypothetical protein